MILGDSKSVLHLTNLCSKGCRLNFPCETNPNPGIGGIKFPPFSRRLLVPGSLLILEKDPYLVLKTGKGDGTGTEGTNTGFLLVLPF